MSETKHDKGHYLFTSESVSEGHPDKVADQISDAILDEFLAFDPQSKVACEVLVTTGQVIIAGEVKSQAYVDLPKVARRVIKRIGYDRAELKFDCESCGVLNALHEQSPDINRGVVRAQAVEQGAGDQGMMFGYATDETADTGTYLPLTLDLSHRLLRELADLRRDPDTRLMKYDVDGRLVTYLRPDAKSQVTVEYDQDDQPVRVDTIVLSTQHDEFVKPSAGVSQEQADKLMRDRIERDVRTHLIPRLREKLPQRVADMIGDDVKILVNPTGKFVIGGPHGDTGLTGRKIIVDTYGGRGAHGGGAFSGKDPSKVDRSAAYAARHIAKNLVAAGVARRALVQVAYAIGVAQPVSLCVNTYGTARVPMTDREIAEKVAGMECFDMRPHAIEERFGLRQPIYEETAAYGHVGREPRRAVKEFESDYEQIVDQRTLPKRLEREVGLFAWEETERTAPKVRQAFGIER